jgi:Cytochrome c7 and related cytochrome c
VSARPRTAPAALAAASLALLHCGDRLPPALAQPASTAPGTSLAEAGEIPLDHKVHAGDLKMPCLSCHVYADRSSVAGIPSGRKCMGCHKFISKDKPAIQLLAQRVDAGQPLRWRRIFALPDHVYFSHRVHIRAKKPIDCKECHGDIAASKTIAQAKPFTMGDCLDCHKAREASRDCLTCHR